MFGGLFDDEDSNSGKSSEPVKNISSRQPSIPRGSTGLCGLSNLGATCYLNSLLQTLHFTPEFREALLSIGECELGNLSDEEGSDNSMVRVIPIQLQRLFARLLLLDQHSADVTALTDSFGWTNKEEFQQHDVQELNRILFSAIESSLLGTSGEHLISKLYHGTTVQQITCRVCGRVSEREETFLDIPAALAGNSGLEEALKEGFIKQEVLDGSNQYYCERCRKLVDATRSCHVRKLPSILTFALLRFLYDLKKGERYKDTSRFKFPTKLDMSPYCEAGSARGDSIYELFSVVIHSGSTYSGHYTAFIRDVDDLGQWTYPDDEPVKLPANLSSGKVDLIDYENPADLLAALLQQLGGRASVHKLCKSLQDQTGVTWNKRFKKQFGPIVKFMESCTDVFGFTDTNQVALKLPNDSTSTSTSHRSPSPAKLGTIHTNNLSESTKGSAQLDHRVDNLIGTDNSQSEDSPEKIGFDGYEASADNSLCKEEEVDVGVNEASKPKGSKPLPPSGYRWFAFNDVHVSCILSRAMERMFQGKESAYMLFYRKQSLRRPPEARENPTFCIPNRLVLEVTVENTKLIEERSAYELAVNTVRLNLHYHSQYYYDNGALHQINNDSKSLLVSIDRRKKIKELKDLIAESYPHLKEVKGKPSVIHTARFLPAGMHLYNIISDKDEASLIALDITDESHLFIWDGVQVNGETIQVGESCEPIQLHVSYPTGGGVVGRDGRREEEEMVVMGFPKDSTLREVRTTLSGLLWTQPNQLTISQVKVQERRGHTQSSVVVLTGAKDKCTLTQLALTDGDKLAAEREIKKGTKTLAHSVADKQNKMISFIVEDRCSPLQDPSDTYPVFPVEMCKDELISNLKRKFLVFKSIEDGVRFRVETDMSGLGPPLYESQTISDAKIRTGDRMIMEHGKPPLNNQIVLQYTMSSSLSEVILDKTITIGECCSIMVKSLGFTGDQWHLCKTNWCGEEANVLEDETATLEQEKLISGDLLKVMEGKLPPKGFIRFAVFLYTPDHTSPLLPPPHVVSEASPTEGGGPTSNVRSPPAYGGGDALSIQDGVASSMEANEEEIPLYSLDPTQFYPPVPGRIQELGTVEVSKDSTMDDLKMHILTLPAFEKTVIPTKRFLRIRELVKGYPGKIFKQGSHTLRRLKFTSDTQVCCQLLNHEEDLSTSVIVFHLCMRNPTERSYGPITEVSYDTENSPRASSPHSLCSYLSELLDVPLDKLRVAKHKKEAFEWILIDDSLQSDTKRHKKGHGSSKFSIKNGPVMLRDGDTIGFKDLRFCDENDKDFSTPQDDKGKAVLLAIQEDKRKRRKAKEELDIFGLEPKEKRQRRPEYGIKIFVPDYKPKE